MWKVEMNEPLKDFHEGILGFPAMLKLTSSFKWSPFSLVTSILATCVSASLLAIFSSFLSSDSFATSDRVLYIGSDSFFFPSL